MEEIPLEFATPQELYKSYMQFLVDGGLFFPTTRHFDMGESLALSVMLPNSYEPISVSGKVAWINPLGASSHTPQGVGVAFIDDKHQLRARIETVLGTLVNSSDPTYTM